MINEEVAGSITASPIRTFSAPDGASEVYQSALCCLSDQHDIELGCQQCVARNSFLQLLFCAASRRKQLSDVIVKLSQPIMMLQHLIEYLALRLTSSRP